MFNKMAMINKILMNRYYFPGKKDFDNGACCLSLEPLPGLSKTIKKHTTLSNSKIKIKSNNNYRHQRSRLLHKVTLYFDSPL